MVLNVFRGSFASLGGNGPQGSDGGTILEMIGSMELEEGLTGIDGGES